MKYLEHAEREVDFMQLRNVATTWQLDKEYCVERSKLLCYFLGYLMETSPQTFLDFCPNMYVFSTIAVSITTIKLFMLAGVWALSDVLCEHAGLECGCK
jgi:hypothetical protein